MSHAYKMCSGWGNRISWTRPEQFHVDHDDDTRFDVNGHQHRVPEIGDTLEAEFEKSVRRFKFVSVKQCWDPPDQFFAQVKCFEVTYRNATGQGEGGGK